MAARIHTLAWVVAVAAVSSAASARSARAETAQPVPPSVVEGVGVVEHLGATAPLDAEFRDHTGADVVLGDLFHDDLPVLLTFNYSNCPQLCDVQLDNLATALADIRLSPGIQFRIVTIVLAPDETPARAGRTRDRYLEHLRELDRDAVIGPQAWTFLLSRDGRDRSQIERVAKAVGFGYRYIERQGEYAHPATMIALSASGMITRYVHGIQPVAADLEATIGKAGLAEPSSSSGFLMTCLHWNPDGRAESAATLMRWGGLGFATVLIVVLVVVLWRRRSRSLPGVDPS